MIIDIKYLVKKINSYEEIYGKGSWKKAMTEWIEITESIVSQAWEMGID